MGVFETIFRKPKADLKAEGYFKMLNGYTPVFSNAPESIYEMELTRAAIHSFASFASKLKPEISGTAQKNLERTLQFKPNPFMDTSKFIYRIATILSVNNTCFIVPIEDEFGGLIGYYPLLPQRCEVVEYNGAPFLRYTFGSGQKAAIEFERVGVMTQFQYTDDFFGESNAALRPTMQLIHTQNQGIINGVKNSASIRFLAKVANMLKPEDITKERKRFTADNLSAENQSGMVIYDAKFADVKPIESKPFTVNAAQMAQINENVFNYFGTNAGILQNKYTEDEWNAYYEGKIEPFAIQLSLVMSNMTYTARELSFGNAITFTANRLQYGKSVLDPVRRPFRRFFYGCMERSIAEDRMLTRHACTAAELSCVIGNIFAELSPPCGGCGAERVTITGTTVTGNAATLTITEAGFDFDGCADDTALLEDMRKGRCIYAKTGAGTERTFGIQRYCEGERPCKAHLHNNEFDRALPEEIPIYPCKQDTG